MTKISIYSGQSCSYKDTLFTAVIYSKGIDKFSNVKLFKGASTYEGDQVLLIKDGKIYKGSIPGMSSQVGTIKDDKIFDALELKQVGGFTKQGVIYKNENKLYSDHVATFKNGKLYKGRNAFGSEQIANANDETALIVAAMYLVLGLGQ